MVVIPRAPESVPVRLCDSPGWGENRGAIMLRTIAALFDNPRDAREVMDDLLRSGFDRHAVRCVARPDIRSRPAAAAAVMGERFAATGMRLLAGIAIGALIAVVMTLLVFALAAPQTELPATASTILLLAALAGAVVGGITGVLSTYGLTDEDEQLYADGVRRGLTLVAVESEGERAGQVEHIMRSHHPVDLERRADRLRTHPWLLASASALATAEHRHARASALATVPRTPASRVYNFYDAMTGRSARAGTSPMRAPPTKSGEETPPTPPYPDSAFRAHFNRHHKTSGHYDDYLPAYRYGYLLAAKIEGGNWENIEREMHVGWERIQPDSWQRYHDAIRYGWEIARAERGLKP